MRNSIGTESQVKSLLTGHMKTYAVYDGNNRTTHFYEAPTFTNDGDPCLLTQFEYDGPTSPNVVKTKESKATWVGTWDL